MPDHDEWMRTSVENVFVAGDAAGFHDGMVLDPEIARGQGRLAGIAAAESLGAIDSAEARGRAGLKSRLNHCESTDRPIRGSFSGWKGWLKVPRRRQRAVCLRVPVRRGDV